VSTKRTKSEVETPYDLVVEGENTKGFDPKKANQKLDLNSDISTEQLLSSLLRARKNPIVKEEIHPKAPTLFELLQDLKNKE
jgi:type IV secretory pathway ATPase VirB11/archaellum biosynthesis ATPase